MVANIMGNKTPALQPAVSGNVVSSMEPYHASYAQLPCDKVHALDDPETDETTMIHNMDGSGPVKIPNVFEIDVLDLVRAPGDISCMQYMATNTRGLLLHYWSLGFSLAFIKNPMCYYFVSVRNVEPDFLNVLVTFIALPFCFKVIFGVISDNFPIFHYRRKPYIYLGWSLFSICSLWLTQIKSLSFKLAIGVLFTMIWGLTIADVAADALVVEWSQIEHVSVRGKLQLYCYIARFLGSFIGVTLGAFICDVSGTRSHVLDISQTCLVTKKLNMYYSLHPFVYINYT